MISELKQIFLFSLAFGALARHIKACLSSRAQAASKMNHQVTFSSLAAVRRVSVSNDSGVTTDASNNDFESPWRSEFSFSATGEGSQVVGIRKLGTISKQKVMKLSSTHRRHMFSLGPLME